MSRLLLYRPRQLTFKGYICDAYDYFADRELLYVECMRMAGKYNRLDVIKDFCLAINSEELDIACILAQYFEIEQIPKVTMLMIFENPSDVRIFLLETMENSNLTNLLYLRKNMRPTEYSNTITTSGKYSNMIARFIAMEVVALNGIQYNCVIHLICGFCKKYNIPYVFKPKTIGPADCFDLSD